MERSAARAPELTLYLGTYTDGPSHDWRAMLEMARAMDAAGVDRLVVSDHVVFGENLDAYGDPSIGGQTGGRQPTGPDGSWLEPLTVLTAIAATTTRIRLGTAVLLAALRRPAVLAKQLATLDVLSVGRVDLGVGVGWQREEYEAVGLSFEDRGRLLDHTLEVCQTLWTQQRASYQSPELTFDGIHQMPKPVQPGGVPVWISGTVNNAVARRIARFGSGWIPWGPAYADIASSVAVMKDKVLAFGGDPTDLQVQGIARVVNGRDGSMDLAATAAEIPALVAAGVTDVRFPASFSFDRDDAVEVLSSLVAAFRDVTC
ncbi:TIGR03619 family F420-dependent LLM class oxidoreductase [Mycobacterium sp. OTB74]|uniref:TIGR03619 family F420-dependent LLM class oxidoreductase n=1 Tax=Mycobacterium sp. OTB74 TaxID=1853452 RepID=UPI0024754AC3|nr:TIGR03619 family F420-dependent LLM class oxidoreductase [Mycobacterium sp. OTB74]MDH6242878.1 putative F420-dependent oxidoreductase [Mycobacterium sp. OTB74]